jgi:TonB family protein
MPDTIGRSKTAPLTLGLAAPQDSANTPEAGYLSVAEAIRAHFHPPKILSLPLWARTSGPADTAYKERSDVPGYGMASGLSFRLTRDGHLADPKIYVRTASPEFNESLIAAVQRADSAGAFSNAGRESRLPRGEIRLRLIDWDRRLGPGIGLIRLLVPILQTDSAVAVRNIPSPVFPRLANQAHIAGEVQLQYVVTADGRADPSSFMVISANYREFVEAAIHAIKRGTFRPAMLGNCAVPMLVRQTIYFKFAY